MQVGKKGPVKLDTQSLDSAIDNLVKGLKRDLQKKYGRVNYTQLRKHGFSDGLIAKLHKV